MDKEKIKERFKNKKMLYMGLLFLYIALFTRIFIGRKESLIFLFIAINFKLLYAYKLIKKTNYKVGYELFLFVVGLTLFLTGLYTELENLVNVRYFLLFSGIILKISSIIIFILKIKNASSKNV